MNTNPEAFNPYDDPQGYDCGDTYESNFPSDEPDTNMNNEPKFTKGQMALIDAGFGMGGNGTWIDPDTGEVMSFEQATAKVAEHSTL
jgi:hypothetical protein